MKQSILGLIKNALSLCFKKRGEHVAQYKFSLEKLGKDIIWFRKEWEAGRGNEAANKFFDFYVE